MEKNYVIIVTTPKNYEIDRKINFGFTGHKKKYENTLKKLNPGDKIVFYVKGLMKFGGIAEVTSKYYFDDSKTWIEDDEMWPARINLKPLLIPDQRELLDVRKLVSNLSFIRNKEMWGLAFQGSLHFIPEDDYNLIESEMRKIVSKKIKEHTVKSELKELRTENDYINAIEKMPLESKSLHDRLGEMLAEIGTWMGYNTNVKFPITENRAYELDTAWLSGKNPEVAFEVQVGGNITEAKDRLAQAKNFNYRKLIIVIKEDQLNRLNKLIQYDDIRHWLEAWSIKSVYDLHHSGKNFFKLSNKVKESVYKDVTKVELQ